MRIELIKKISLVLAVAMVVVTAFSGFDIKVSALEGKASVTTAHEEEEITSGEQAEETTKDELLPEESTTEEPTQEPVTEEPTTEPITEPPTTEPPTTVDYEIINNVYKVRKGVLIEYLGDPKDTKTTKIKIPASITKIDAYVFDSYKYIESVSFEKKSKLTEIGDCAFVYCSGLTEITLPKGLKKIGYKAFARCSSLKKLTIPSTVTAGDTIFGTKGKMTTVVFAEGTTVIPDNILKAANSVTKVTLYSGVKTIGKKAFYKCSALKKISLPATVTTVKKSAFYSCTAMTKVTGSKYITTIGTEAFKKCTSLTSLELKEKMSSIGTNAFAGNSKLVLLVHANSYAKAYARKNKLKWDYTSSEKKRRAKNQEIYNNFVKLIKTADKNKFKLKYLADYVPQGSCVIGKYVVVSMYHKTLSKNSILLVYKKSTGAFVKKVILPSRDHVGAITNVKKRFVVSLNNTGAVDYVSVISYSRLKKIKSGKTIKYNYKLRLSGASDFAAFDGKYFWSGSSAIGKNGSMQGYKVKVKKKKLVFTRKYSYSVLPNIQGLVVQKVSSKKRKFIFSKSYGRLNNSSLITYSTTLKSGGSLGSAVSTKTLPSMLEGISMSGSYMYFVFESGSGLYCGNPDNTSEIQIKNICKIKC